jgi:hypothetical protein
VKKQLRIGKPCVFIAALVLLAVSGVNAQKIKLGTITPVYSNIDLSHIITQTPLSGADGPALGFYIDAPMSTLRNSNGTTIDFYATNWHGIDIFRAATQELPFGNSPITSGYNPAHYSDCQSTAASKPGIVWLNREDITNQSLIEYRARNVRTLRYCKAANRLNGQPNPNGQPVSTPDSRGWLDEEAWIPNIYKVTSTDVANVKNINSSSTIAAGDLLGFVHVETINVAGNREDYSIGLAYSKTNGVSWVYCGDIIRLARNTGNGSSPGTVPIQWSDNIAGIPMLVVPCPDANYFYVYFNDYPDPDWSTSQNSQMYWPGKRGCVARAKVLNVLDTVSRIYNQVIINTPINALINMVRFHKCIYVNPAGSTTYSKGSYPTNSTNWDLNDAISLPEHVGADLFAFENRPVPTPDLHADAVWCAPLNRYLMTVSSGWRGVWSPPGTETSGELRLYSSIDGINWGNPIIVGNTGGANILDNFGPTDGSDHIEKPHSFFVSSDVDASDDSHIVGKHFYIYWARSHWDLGTTMTSQEMMRCEVNIIDLGSFNNDNKADLMFYDPSNITIMVDSSKGSGFKTPSIWGPGYISIKDNFFPADFDGDGKVDLGYYDAPNNAFMVSLSTGLYFSSAIQWLSGTTSYPYPSSADVLFGSVGGKAGTFYVGDFNGDGKADLMYFNPADFSYWANSIWVSTANATGTHLDGPGSGLWSPSNNFGSQKDNYFAADFNGDGKTDLCYHETNNYFYVLLSSGTSFDWNVPGSGTWLNTDAGVLLGVYDCSYYVGDFNGDGRADLLCVDQHNGYKISVSTSTGTGFNGPGSGQWYPSNGRFNYNKDNFFTADFDGDGKTDLGYSDLSTGFWVNLSAGSVFTSWVQWGGPGSINYQYYVSNSLNKKTTTYLVRSSAGPNGTVSPLGIVTTAVGTARTLTITPSANCVINYVMVDGANIGAVTTYTFPSTTIGTHSISAYFAPKLTISSATALSVNGTTNTAAKAIDKNMNTRWESKQGVDPQWIYVDLGSAKNICTVKLFWETANAKDYTLEGSNVSSFTTKTVLATQPGMPTGKRNDNITGLSGSYRYIRMYGTARNTVYGYSIYEFEVYGN